MMVREAASDGGRFGVYLNQSVVRTCSNQKQLRVRREMLLKLIAHDISKERLTLEPDLRVHVSKSAHTRDVSNIDRT